jgi:hypothetical protein
MSKTGKDSAQRLALDLDEALPDEVILRDLRRVLAEDANPSLCLEGDDGEIQLTIDAANVGLEVVTKCYLHERYEVGFGNHYRILVAIGGVEGVSSGIATARICFALLYYNEEPGLITLDYSLTML